MSMKYNRQLPGPGELKEEYPLTPALAQLKAQRDEEIRQVFEGKSENSWWWWGPAPLTGKTPCWSTPAAWQSLRSRWGTSCC